MKALTEFIRRLPKNYYKWNYFYLTICMSKNPFLLSVLALCIITLSAPQTTSAFGATSGDIYTALKKIAAQVELLSQQLGTAASVSTALSLSASSTSFLLDQQYGEIKSLASSSVAVTKDISYGKKSSEKFDLYRPARFSKTRQIGTVIMVHGGAWKTGDKAMEGVYQNKVNYFIPKGYAVISVNYPLENIDPKEQVDAIGAAVSYIQRNARTLGVDPKKIVLMGHSAGAHLVSLLTADPDIRTRQGVQPWLATISLDTAVFDVVAKMESGSAPAIYRPAFGSSTAFWEEMSPYHQYEKSVEPILAVCSSTRADTPCVEAERFKTMITKESGVASVLSVRLSHGDINKNLGLRNIYTANVQRFLNTVGF